MSEFKKVAEVASLGQGEITAVDYDGESVLLANVGGEIRTVSDTCPHAGLPLSDGYLDEDENQVECSYHGSVFDLVTGEAIEGPSEEAVTSAQHPSHSVVGPDDPTSHRSHASRPFSMGDISARLLRTEAAGPFLRRSLSPTEWLAGSRDGSWADKTS